MKKNVIRAIRWAIFIPCALSVSLITCIAITYVSDYCLHTLASYPTQSLPHIVCGILTGILGVYIYYKVGMKVAPPTRKRLSNAVLFMSFVSLEVSLIITTTGELSSYTSQPAETASTLETLSSHTFTEYTSLQLLYNIVAILTAVTIFLNNSLNLRRTPTHKRHFKRLMP